MRCDKTIFLLLVAYSSWQLSLIPLPNSLSVANLTLFWLKLYQDGVFALPETMDFTCMIYRQDVLTELGLTLPETWEEL